MNSNDDKISVFTKSRLPESCLFANLRRWATKLAPERVGEVTMTRETEFERDGSDVFGARGESLQRRAQPELCEITMDRNTSLFLKYTRQVKRRRVHRARHIVERDSLTHVGRKISLRSFGAIGVIGICGPALWLGRAAAMNKRRLEHICNELQRGDVRPQRFEGI